MRKALVAIAMLGTVVTVAAATAVGAPKTDVVAGSAKFDSVEVHINAQSGPNGEDARGRFTLMGPALTIEGDISCLNVAGNKALAGGTIVSSSIPAFVGQGFYQLTVDNGSPGKDDQSQTSILAAPPAACPAPSGGGFTLTSGNYTVHDAG